MWGGPASMTDRIAAALWFRDREDFYRPDQRDRLLAALTAGEPLAPRDWHRCLAATELAFASWVLGAAGDWLIVSGIDDAVTLAHIRSIQGKIAWVRPWPEPYARPGHAAG
jgi:hypothetical protein